MPIVQEQKFKRKDENKIGDIVQVWLNKEQRIEFEEAKIIINQKKDGTAMRQLAFIGAKLVSSPEIAYILDQIHSNKRKNKRVGIVDFE